ncbi:hypothetical protein BDZ45DRAFT_742706 [Acephala macrosclerotiorum]|nr:hypothetical protein BDZ45DRAFT_742706 [Acephala macrosclerotiorum]
MKQRQRMQPYNTFPLQPGWNPFNEDCSTTNAVIHPASHPCLPTQYSSSSSSDLFIDFKPRSRADIQSRISTSNRAFVDAPLPNTSCTNCSYTLNLIHRQHLSFPFPVSTRGFDPRDDHDSVSSRGEPPLVEIQKEELIFLPPDTQSKSKIKSKNLAPPREKPFDFSGKKEKEKIYLACRRGQPWHPALNSQEHFVQKRRAFGIPCPGCGKVEFEIWYLAWKVKEVYKFGKERVMVRSESKREMKMKDRKETDSGCSSWEDAEKSKIGEWFKGVLSCCEKVWMAGILGWKGAEKSGGI